MTKQEKEMHHKAAMKREKKIKEHGEMVELLKEVIQLGHSNSDKICKCPDCKNAIKIKSLLSRIKAKS